MKIQIAFDMPDLDAAMSLATTLEDRIDIIEIGSPLLYAHGRVAIETFRQAFPQKNILADMKIVDRGREAATIGLKAGASWITVLAGTSKSVIHAVSSTAHEFGKRTMLDLIDAQSPGQSALESEALGIDALLFHRPTYDEGEEISFFERWEMVRGNTNLPIFVALPPHFAQIAPYLALKPSGIVISTLVTAAPEPRAMLESIIALL